MAIRKALLAVLKRAVAVATAGSSGAARGATPAAAATLRPEPAGASTSLESPVSSERPLEVDAPIRGSVLLDIREPAELAGGVAPEALLIPMNCVPHQLDRLDRTRPITVYCAAGARSLGVAHWLREQGFDAASLEGGIQSLRWGAAPIELRFPAGAGERVTVGPGATLDGVPLAPCMAEGVDGDRVRIIDSTGLQIVGELRRPPTSGAPTPDTMP